MVLCVNRGEIWWADLDEPVGSAPGYPRPVLVMQSNYYNHSGLKTVVAVALTSNLRLADAPGNVLLTRRKTGLLKDSVASVTQLLAVDKDALRDKVGSLDPETLSRVTQGVRDVLDL